MINWISSLQEDQQQENSTTTTTTTTNTSEQDNNNNNIPIILNSKIEVRPIPSGGYHIIINGIHFMQKKIFKRMKFLHKYHGSILLMEETRHIIKSWILMMTEYDDYITTNLSRCRLVRRLARAMQIIQTKKLRANSIVENYRKKSLLDPYLEYLSSNPPTIPSYWSEGGRTLLQEIIGGGGGNSKQHTIPPRNIETILDEEEAFCEAAHEDHLIDNTLRMGITDEYLEWATATVHEKSHHNNWMIPLFDLFAHRNGDYYNVYTDVQPGVFHAVKARRKIIAGEPLHYSYDRCDECSHMKDVVAGAYGTPGM